MSVEIVTADPRVKENVGKRAVQREPLVYCMEEIDNENSFEKTSLTPNTLFTTAYSPSFLNGVVSFTASSPEKKYHFNPLLCLG